MRPEDFKPGALIKWVDHSGRSMRGSTYLLLTAEINQSGTHAVAEYLIVDSAWSKMNMTIHTASLFLLEDYELVSSCDRGSANEL